MPQHTSPIRSAALLMALMISVDGCSSAVPSATPSSPTLLVPASPSATAPPTHQPTPAVIAEAQCIPIEENAPADLSLSGVWLRNQYIPYLEDPVTATDTRIPFEGGGVFGEWKGDAAISPDRKHLAYIDQYSDPVIKYRPVKRILRVVSSYGHSLQLAYWKEDWQYIIGWVDNQTLALFTGARTVVRLNPFTGDWDTLSEPAWLIDMGYTGDKYHSGLFAPTSDRVLLRAAGGGSDIRDFQSGDVLFHGPNMDRRDIDWSADESIFTFISGHQLTTIMPGQPPSVLDLGQSGAAFDSYGGLKLSPDEHKTAFVGADWYPDGDGGHLFVYDRAHSALYSVCSDGFFVEGWQETIWSPDSRFLIVAIVQRSEAWSPPEFDLLLDTQEWRAFKLISGYRQHRLFWLAAP